MGADCTDVRKRTDPLNGGDCKLTTLHGLLALLLKFLHVRILDNLELVLPLGSTGALADSVEERLERVGGESNGLGNLEITISREPPPPPPHSE